MTTRSRTLQYLQRNTRQTFHDSFPVAERGRRCAHSCPDQPRTAPAAGRQQPEPGSVPYRSPSQTIELTTY
jgi:hypothetical protein